MKIIPFDLLRVLIAVGDSKNLRDAALILGISQPAVSFKLKRLELQLGVPLFSLEGRRKVLTHFGRALYELSKAKDLNLNCSIEELRRQYENEECLTIRIGGRSEVLEYITPLVRFGGKVELRSLSSREAIRQLQSHKIDIAISHIRPDSIELQAKKLFKSKTYFAAHRKLLKKNTTLTLDLILDQEFLRRTPSISYVSEGELLETLAKRVNLEATDLNVKFASEDWHCVLSLVEKGIGYSILPSYILSNSKEVEILELPEKLIPQFDFYAIFETSLRKVKAFQNLLKFEII